MKWRRNVLIACSLSPFIIWESLRNISFRGIVIACGLCLLVSGGIWWDYMETPGYESPAFRCFVVDGTFRCPGDVRRLPNADIRFRYIARLPVDGDVLECTRNVFNFAGRIRPMDNKLLCTGCDLLRLTRPTF